MVWYTLQIMNWKLFFFFEYHKNQFNLRDWTYKIRLNLMSWLLLFCSEHWHDDLRGIACIIDTSNIRFSSFVTNNIHMPLTQFICKNKKTINLISWGSSEGIMTSVIPKTKQDKILSHNTYSRTWILFKLIAYITRKLVRGSCLWPLKDDLATTKPRS